MKQKRYSKLGREMKAKGLLRGVSGEQPRHFKGGAHTPDTSYRRSDKKREEQRAQRGDYE